MWPGFSDHVRIGPSARIIEMWLSCRAGNSCISWIGPFSRIIEIWLPVRQWCGNENCHARVSSILANASVGLLGFQRQGNDGSRKHCHARVVETGAYILVFSVTNFWSALSVASQIFIWGSHFCGAMKFLALCRWWLEAAFMKCGMGVHWFYWFTMVTRCMRWCCSLTGVSMQIWFAMVHMQIELTLCVMSVPLHLWKRFFVFAKCG